MIFNNFFVGWGMGFGSAPTSNNLKPIKICMK